MDYVTIGTLIVSIASCLIALQSLYISRNTHKMSLFSQKLQNAHALVKSFYSSLREGDVKRFRDIIILRGESAGGDNNGHYMRDDGQLCDFSEYFTEGAPDEGALERIVLNLDRVCSFARKETVDLRFFYSELGQYIQICHEILKAMCNAENVEDDNIMRSFKELKSSYADVIMSVVGYIE